MVTNARRARQGAALRACRLLRAPPHRPLGASVERLVAANRGATGNAAASDADAMAAPSRPSRGT
ncbi:MAG TPA: hypothetical protein VF291_14410, partial [Burkholderiaceae bacterium]